MSNSDKVRENLSDQLVKLGDMMGDGLHNEPGGAWINREYRRVLKAMEPEIFAEQRKKKRDRVNDQIKNLIEAKNCPCGGSFRQSRSGSVILYCNSCDGRFKATSKRKKNG